MEWLGSEARQTLHHATGFLHLLAEEPLTARQAHNLTHCAAGLEELLRRVNVVADLAAAEGAVPGPAVVNLPGLMRGAGDWMATLCARRGAAFEAHSSGLPEWVEIAGSVLQSMLYRVLELRLGAAGVTGVSLTARWEAGVLEADVFDTGAPLEVAEIQAVIPRTLLRRAGGSLEVASNASDGVVLRLRLAAPVAHPVGQCPPAVLTWGEDRAGQMSLLVAEDNDESFALFEAFVQDAGHTVERAGNGEQAVAAFQRGQYDLVVMDVRMPIMDGYTATRLIRDWETGRGCARVPIILMSAESSERLTRIGAEVGCSGYLTKPTMQADLLRVLRHYGPVSRVTA
jgi:CheY-like chemotaxis protein